MLNVLCAAALVFMVFGVLCGGLLVNYLQYTRNIFHHSVPRYKEDRYENAGIYILLSILTPLAAYGFFGALGFLVVLCAITFGGFKMLAIGFNFRLPVLGTSRNVVFDEYQRKEYERLRSERSNFALFMEKLRHEKDNADFQRFINEHPLERK